MKRLLKIVLVALSIIFIMLQFLEMKVYAFGVKAAILIGLTILYLHVVKKRRLFFLLFLVFFTLAEVINFSSAFMPKPAKDEINWNYYICNLLSILSYSFLIVQVIRSMNVRAMLNRYPLHIATLVVLDIFFVWIVSGTAETESELTFTQLSLEITYNSVIMILLSAALINYIDRDDTKSMNLLIGTIFIVFAEVIQLAYFYVANDFNFLNVICSTFLIFALLFFYLQARLTHKTHQLNYNSSSDFQELEPQEN
ncbi:hypothetical protein SAMN03097699_1329 [Flavobacteriaceae bacterium MAR_2010_188]|nr:hypothetical protein SAMN03097699_1329 [Flavobacteriaceae bacterium MAR_2010_188]